jgi:hypothetical protein
MGVAVVEVFDGVVGTTVPRPRNSNIHKINDIEGIPAVVCAEAEL